MTMGIGGDIMLRKWSPIAAVALFACGLPSLQASASLLPSPDGTTVYDTTNNVSWLTDSNLAASNKFGLPVCNGTVNTKTCVNASGSMSYQAATAWVAAMNAANYLGHTNWQLPATPLTDSNCGFIGPNGASFGFNCLAGALSSLYYTALGLTAPNTAVPIPNNTTGPFSNFQPYLYWSQTNNGGIGYGTFSFNTGIQGSNTKPNFLYALPMIPGKIPGTPPASGNGLQVNPGGQTVYDPVANVTWLANANLAATNAFGLPPCTAPGKPQMCVNQDGAMNWDSAAQLVTNMNAGTGYLGQKLWQLPPVDPNCATYYNCANSPLGELFYGQLGLSAGMPVVTTPDTAVGPFRHIQPYLYWSCEAATIQDACQTTGPASGFEFSFSFGNGFLGTDILQNEFYVTAYFVNECTYSLSSGGQAFTASGGTGSITIATQAGCPWVVGALPVGVTLTSPGSGAGSGSVTFQVTPNAGGDVSASFTIAGQTFTIEQAAASIAGLAVAGSLGQVASEGGWDFSLIGINLGASAATARFTFADNNGNPLPLPLTFPQSSPTGEPELAATLDRTLNPNAQIVMDSTGPDSAATLVGAGQLLSNGNVSGFGIFSNPKVHWNAVVPLETRNASKYILAFDNTGPLTTGLAVANLAAQTVSVPVIIRDDKGNLIGNPTPPIPLGALGHTSFMLNDPQLGYPVTKGQRGTIEFDTPPGGQLSVLGLRANGPALTTLPVLANVGTSGGSITHIAYTGGWTSVFYLVNTGNASASFTLSFVDENGIALGVPLLLPSGTTMTTSALTQTLAAGAMLVVETDAQDSPTPVVGSAQLTTTGNIGGFEVFRWNTFNQEASVPLESRTPKSFVLVFDDTNGLTTGVALASNFGLQANITATFHDDAGTQIGLPQPINIAAHGHKSFLLPDLFQAAAGKRGMVEFAAPQGQNISVIGLRARSSDGTLTTIPVLTK
jgi:hypothetical protein